MKSLEYVELRNNLVRGNETQHEIYNYYESINCASFSH
jgi:hypothetical protein